MRKSIELMLQNETYAIIFLIGVSVLCGLLLRFIFIKTLLFTARKTDRFTLNSVAKNLGKGTFFFFPVLIATLLFKLGPWMSESLQKDLSLLMTILTVMACCYLAIKMLQIGQDYLLHKFDVTKKNNNRERKIITQVKFFKKVSIVIVLILGLTVIFLSIESLRKLGLGILSSAGVIGIMVGFAAQKSIANLLAGVQIAITQPIKLDDAVVVEGEWGWIEEINLTYVVIRIWDLRRMVVPINYFIEKPFQNWTRNSADIIGSVFLYTDYSFSMEALRQELDKILENEPLWDKRVKVAQVTHSTEKSMEIRVLVSARTSPETWDLRCVVREKLIDFLQREYPDTLPFFRTTLTKDGHMTSASPTGNLD
jgi:small-conductance mechanosensitive channel